MFLLFCNHSVMCLRSLLMFRKLGLSLWGLVWVARVNECCKCKCSKNVVGNCLQLVYLEAYKRSRFSCTKQGH